MVINVFGDPAPQGSKTIMRGRLVEASSKKLVPWRKAVQTAALAYLAETGHRPFKEAVKLKVIFYVQRPKSVKRQFPTVPADLDKLVRAVGDALTYGEVWGDDSQVIHLDCKKFYADTRAPGAEIEIHSITN